MGERGALPRPGVALRSLRARIALAATGVVAVAVGAAGWVLVRSVEHQLVDKVRAEGTARVAAAVEQLETGTPADRVGSPGQETFGFVQVLDSDGRAIGGPAVQVFAPPIMVLTSGPVTPAIAGTEVTTAPPGLGEGVSFDIRYQSVDTAQGLVTVLAASPLDGVERSITALKGALLWALPGLVVLVGASAWFVVGRALRPVEAIRAEVEAISAGTLHRRVPEPGTGDEVERLARTMNAMLDRLHGASSRQRQFVADASHELRSPVAAIRTGLEVALGTSDPDWPMVAVDALAEEARLERLVADLLLLAAVDERPSPDGDAVTDLSALTRAQAGRSRSLPVCVAGVEAGCLVRGRSDRLERAVANLVDNGCRHAAATVRLSLRHLGEGTVRLEVDDDGPGIPTADRERVFERFTRLETSRSRHPGGGAGLGLALTRAVVESLGGHVHAEGSPLGGARLSVTLPSAAPRRVAGHDPSGHRRPTRER